VAALASHPRFFLAALAISGLPPLPVFALALRRASLTRLATHEVLPAAVRLLRLVVAAPRRALVIRLAAVPLVVAALLRPTVFFLVLRAISALPMEPYLDPDFFLAILPLSAPLNLFILIIQPLLYRPRPHRTRTRFQV